LRVCDSECSWKGLELDIPMLASYSSLKVSGGVILRWTKHEAATCTSVSVKNGRCLGVGVWVNRCGVGKLGGVWVGAHRCGCAPITWSVRWCVCVLHRLHNWCGCAPITWSVRWCVCVLHRLHNRCWCSVESDTGYVIGIVCVV